MGEKVRMTQLTEVELESRWVPESARRANGPVWQFTSAIRSKTNRSRHAHTHDTSTLVQTITQTQSPSLCLSHMHRVHITGMGYGVLKVHILQCSQTEVASPWGGNHRNRMMRGHFPLRLVSSRKRTKHWQAHAHVHTHTHTHTHIHTAIALWLAGSLWIRRLCTMERLCWHSFQREWRNSPIMLHSVPYRSTTHIIHPL